jgi:hypothetical protein
LHVFFLYAEFKFFKKGEHESSRGTIWEEDGDQWEGMRDTRESIGQVNVMKVIKYMWKNVMMKPIKMYTN